MLPGAGGTAVALLGLLPFQEPQGVEVPLFPVVAAGLGLVGLLVLSAGVLRTPTIRRARRARSAAPPPTPVVAAPAPAPPPPVYRKAPAAIEFVGIPPQWPDVWGTGEPLDIQVRLTDKGLEGQKAIPGLALTVAGLAVPLLFLRGTATHRRTFPQKGEFEVAVELRVKNENLPRRTSRRVKIVEWREEIAEVFHNFKQEASRAITPLRDDATPWEVYDAVTEANPRLPREAIRQIVTSFEEAKFSNHPVSRSTYERMIRALLEIERVET